MGLVEAERFTCSVHRKKFDCTKSRQSLFDGLSGEEISRLAMEWRQAMKT
jgi:hypothetical protein